MAAAKAMQASGGRRQEEESEQLQITAESAVPRHPGRRFLRPRSSAKSSRHHLPLPHCLGAVANSPGLT